MKILAIETSCDESGLAILKCSGTIKNPEIKLLKSVVASQIKIHAPWGGVVPNLAKREHVKNLPVLFHELFPKVSVEIGGTESRPKFKFSDLRGKNKLPIDEIAVTVGPGLEPALWMGITFAKDLSKASGIPLKGANHLEGHLFSFLLTQKKGSKTKKEDGKIFPAVALIASGGHTVLLKLDKIDKWKRVGETRDDAAGEAYDKVARLLDLPYPGGPNLEKLALTGDPLVINFPRPMLNPSTNSGTGGNFDFSFSGLKTAVLYYMRDHKSDEPEFKSNVAASFQQAVIDVLVGKTIRAAKEIGAKSVILSGGVAANKSLRESLGKAAKSYGCRYLVPPWEYNTDNAAMVGVAAYLAKLRRKSYPLRANGSLEI